jgi:GWxTD domain-containing protein
VRSAPLVGLALALQIATVTGPARAKDDPLRQWLDGPVHYLVTPDEIKEFKAQKNDADRVAFIERFWRRRDPTPDTLSNEYRQLFWTRVKEANEKFLDSAGPGWKTDRGKIYILYGPPDEQKEDVNAHAGSEVDDSKGLIRWVYLKPGGRRDVDPVVYVPFVRDVTGEYRLSYDPALSSPFFNWNAIDDRRTAGLGSFMSGIQPGSKDPLGVRLDLGKMQEVPPQEKFVMDSVESVETFAYQPLPLAIDRFRLDAGGCVTVLTVAIPGPADSVTPALMARFARKSAGVSAHLLGEGSFRVEDAGSQRIAQARVTLEAGTWDLTVLAVDPASGVSRIFKGKVTTLPAVAPLLLSDVVLAREMEPLPFATQASYDSPYIVGGFRVTPRVPDVVPRGDPVRLFFEIYAGTSPYHVVYQLEGQEDDGRWRALGRPQEREAATRGQGYEVFTSPTWPFGAYRIRVRVIDAAGLPAETIVPFTLVAQEQPPDANAPVPIVHEP